jgi:hypothetical protein
MKSGGEPGFEPTGRRKQMVCIGLAYRRREERGLCHSPRLPLRMNIIA